MAGVQAFEIETCTVDWIARSWSAVNSEESERPAAPSSKSSSTDAGLCSVGCMGSSSESELLAAKTSSWLPSLSGSATGSSSLL